MKRKVDFCLTIAAVERKTELASLQLYFRSIDIHRWITKIKNDYRACRTVDKSNEFVINGTKSISERTFVRG